MEVGLVSIDFIGVATSALAAIEKINLGIAEMRKRAEMPLVFGAGIAGSGGGVAQSVESQVAPVRAVSAARQKIYKDEMEANAASESTLITANNARIEKELTSYKAFITEQELNYDKFIATLKAKTAAAQASMTIPPIATPGYAERNLGEAERGGAIPIPLPMPSEEREPLFPRMPKVPKTPIEDAEERGFGSYWKYRGGEMALRGMGEINPESMISSGLSSGGGIASNLGMLGFLSGNPWVIGGGVAGAVGLGLAGATAHFGGGFETAGAKLEAGTQMSQSALKAFQQVAREQALKSGNTPGSTAPDYLEAARTLVFALHLSGDQIDQNLPALVRMMRTVRDYAVAMGIPVADAANDLVTKFNLTGGKMSDERPAQEFKKVADMFAMATTRGALKPEELGAAVRKSGGVAAFEGLPTSDVLAALEIMGTSGDTGQIIGTALRQYMLTFGGAKQSPKLTKELTGAGLSMQDISTAHKSLPDAIQTLKEHLGTMTPGGEFQGGTSNISPEDRTELLKTLFGQRWLSFYQQLSTNLPSLRKISGDIQTQSGGSVERMAGTMEGTMQFKEGGLKKQLDDLFIGAFQDDKGDFKKLVDDISKLLSDVKENEPLLAKGVDAIVKLVDALVKAAALVIDIPHVAKMSLTHIGQGNGVFLDENGNPVYADQIQAPPGSLTQKTTQISEAAKAYVSGLTGANKPRAQAILSEMLNRIAQDRTSALNAKTGEDAYGYYKDIDTVLSYLGQNFEVGGHTGHGRDTDVAGYVHANEYVLDAPTVRRVGLNRVKALHKRLRGYGGGGDVTPVDWSDLRTDEIDQPQQGLPTMGLPTIPIAGESGGDMPSIADALLNMLMNDGGMNRAADLIHGKATFQRLWNSANAGDVASGIASFGQSGQGQMLMKALGASQGLRNFAGGNTLSDIAQIVGMGTQSHPMQSVSLSGEDAYGHVTSDVARSWIAQAHKAANPSAANVAGDVIGHAAPFAGMLFPGSGQFLSQFSNVLGSFAAGTPYVPKTGLYQLHAGEAVTPAHMNTGGPLRLHPDTIKEMVGAFSAVQLGIEPTSIRTGLAQGNNSFQTWD